MRAAILAIPSHRHCQAGPVGFHGIVIFTLGQFHAVSASSAALVIEAFDDDFTGAERTRPVQPDNQSVDGHASTGLSGAKEIGGLTQDSLLTGSYLQGHGARVVGR